MRPPVICVTGPSNSGKTWIVEQLVRYLGAEGYRVAAVKHCPHGYRLDEPGTDSDRLARAGAARVALASPGEWVVRERVSIEPSLSDLVEAVGRGCHLVVAEGFRSSEALKIVVLPRDGADPSWEYPDGVVAVVSDAPAGEAPWRCGFNEVERLAWFVRDLLLAAEPVRPGMD